MNADKLADALRIARNGLQWYQDRYPESADGCDDEAMAQIDAALSEHDTRPAQATWSDERPSVMWLPNRISAKDLAFSTTDECLAYQNGWNHCIEATLSSPENKMRKPDAVDKACEAVAAASHRLFYGSGSAQAAQTMGVPDGLTETELGVIETLLNLAYAAWNLADNTEDAGSEGLTVERSDFAGLETHLDKLDSLPDDRPDYVMEAAAKARWALRRLLAASQPPAQPVGVPDGAKVIAQFVAERVSMGRGDERYIGTADGARGVTVRYGDPGEVRNDLLWLIADAMLAAAPQPPAQPSADAEDAALLRLMVPGLHVYAGAHVVQIDAGKLGLFTERFINEDDKPRALRAVQQAAIDAARAAEGDGDE